MISRRVFAIVAIVGALVLGLVACDSETPPVSSPTPTPKPVVEPEEEAPPEIEEEAVPASIGDYVWHDTDQDGIQDDPEPAMPQVAVELYDSDDTLVASATTDPDGGYSFTNVAPGEYYVQFTLPATYLFTQQDQGDDDSVDSDADPTTGETVLITLDPGATDLTWDAGMFEAEPPTPTPTLTPSPTPTHTPSPVTEDVGATLVGLAAAGEKVWFGVPTDGPVTIEEIAAEACKDGGSEWVHTRWGFGDAVQVGPEGKFRISGLQAGEEGRVFAGLWFCPDSNRIWVVSATDYFKVTAEEAKEGKQVDVGRANQHLVECPCD